MRLKYPPVICTLPNCVMIVTTSNAIQRIPYDYVNTKMVLVWRFRGLQNPIFQNPALFLSFWILLICTDNKNEDWRIDWMGEGGCGGVPHTQMAACRIYIPSRTASVVLMVHSSTLTLRIDGRSPIPEYLLGHVKHRSNNNVENSYPRRTEGAAWSLWFFDLVNT